MGAEYFINENFSLGGEASYLMISQEVEEETFKTTTLNNWLIQRFMIRFYF